MFNTIRNFFMGPAKKSAGDILTKAKRDVGDTTAAIEKKVEKAKLAKLVKDAALTIDKNVAQMTKAKIEEHGREFGIELDRRMTKPNMVSDLKAKVKSLKAKKSKLK